MVFYSVVIFLKNKVDFARDIVSSVMKLQSKDNNTLIPNEITVSLVLVFEGCEYANLTMEKVFAVYFLPKRL